MPKTRLCERCNGLRLELARAEKEVSQDVSGSEVRRRTLDRKVRLTQKQIEIAKREGARYGNIDDISMFLGLTLEHELDLISKLAVSKSLYGNWAGILERHFTVEEQRKILELLAPIGRAHFRKNLRGLAEGELTWTELSNGGETLPTP